jgi:hypothetical protein
MQSVWFAHDPQSVMAEGAIQVPPPLDPPAPPGPVVVPVVAAVDAACEAETVVPVVEVDVLPLLPPVPLVPPVVLDEPHATTATMEITTAPNAQVFMYLPPTARLRLVLR